MTLAVHTGIHTARRTRDSQRMQGRRGRSGYSHVDRHVLQAIPHFPAGARDAENAPVEPDHLKLVPWTEFLATP